VGWQINRGMERDKGRFLWGNFGKKFSACFKVFVLFFCFSLVFKNFLNI
jgi:hypothetical protein